MTRIQDQLIWIVYATHLMIRVVFPVSQLELVYINTRLIWYTRIIQINDKSNRIESLKNIPSVFFSLNKHIFEPI